MIFFSSSSYLSYIFLTQTSSLFLVMKPSTVTAWMCPWSTVPVSHQVLSLEQHRLLISMKALLTCHIGLQYEGAYNLSGKGQSMWDNYTHTYPDKIADKSNGDVADDSYYLYKEDVRVIKEMGLDTYRFSISWSRILPRGKLRGGVNKEGIKYYNNLINELIDNGIKPFVTIFHFDVPQALQDEYGGFLSPQIVNDFCDFADLLFGEFGNRVKHWITVNEPWAFSNYGYAIAVYAPGRCSSWQNLNCTSGDSSTEPYLVTHHLLLAHAEAVNLYKQKYQKWQNGKIGITLLSNWFVPFSNSREDQKAQQRALDFMLGWSMDPLIFGHYPHSMRSLVGSRLPKFTAEQSRMVKGSFDFIGLNYYTTNYAINAPNASSLSFTTDSQVKLTGMRNGVLIGEQAGSSWLYIYPRGIRELLIYIKAKYNDPLIYITENGVDEVNNASLPLMEALNDKLRIDYLHGHLCCLQEAINENGVNVMGYFVWSLLDNFEWSDGYTVRFGLYYVDYNNGLLTRYPKLSAKWFKNIIVKEVRQSSLGVSDQ